MTATFNCEDCRKNPNGKCNFRIDGMKRYGLEDIFPSVEDCIIISARDDYVSRHLYYLWTVWRDKNILPEIVGADDIWQVHQDAFDICHKYEREIEKQRREDNKKNG